MELNKQDKINNETPSDTKLNIVGFIWDLPNACTLLGLLSATLGIYFSVTENVYFAVIGMVWAVFFDWLDGLIASKLKNRTGKRREFGGQLDSLVDMVSFGVLPALILLSYSGFNAWFIPGAFAIIGACAIRLSYFNIYGLSSGKCYTGLPVALAFIFENYFRGEIFSLSLYAIIMIMVFFNLSSLQIPKFSKKVIYGILAFSIFITIYLGF